MKKRSSSSRMMEKINPILKGGNPMLYVGINYHNKRCLQAKVINEKGRQRVSTRLPNAFRAIKDFFHSLAL